MREFSPRLGGKKRFIVRTKRREREREEERERETKTRISRDISNSLGQICRLFVLEAAIQRERERESARAFLTRLCVQIYAPRVHRAFRSSVPGILSLPLSRRLLDARD